MAHFKVDSFHNSIIHTFTPFLHSLPSFTPLPIPPFHHSLIHSFTYSFIHLFTPSPIHSFTHCRSRRNKLFLILNFVCWIILLYYICQTIRRCGTWLYSFDTGSIALWRKWFVSCFIGTFTLSLNFYHKYILEAYNLNNCL